MLSTRAVGAGAFVVIGATLFTAALFLIGERRNLFENRFPVYAEFSKLGQLDVGAIVRVSGADAGEVTEIHVPQSPSAKFRVRMDVREDLHQLVRVDSVAMMQTDGLVGNIFVNIETGSEQTNPISKGGTIQSKEPFSMADLLDQMSDTVVLVHTTVASMRGDIEGAVREVALTTKEAHALLTDIRPDLTTMARNGAQLSTNAEQLMAGLRQGRGTIGKLINDDALYVQARGLADQAHEVLGTVTAVTAEARRAISDLRSKDGPAQGLFADMRGTINQAREATADLADNMEAMKHNFLLKGFFSRRGYFDLDAISPHEYRSGVLENGKRKAMRIWLGTPAVFETGPDGVEILADGGRARLDSAMATYLKYLPSNPMVVEGYSTLGTADERFRQARDRAGIVREYLLARYQLMPQNIGFMALGDEAPGSPDNGRWDGIALTLFLDRGALQFSGERALR